jgi:hypothetical protein
MHSPPSGGECIMIHERIPRITVNRGNLVA